MSPLERAARALFTRDPGPYGDCIEWAIEQDFGWRDRVDDARAVIEAIREPSTQMIDAMYDEYQGGGKGSLRDCWFEAIDTLLEEGA